MQARSESNALFGVIFLLIALIVGYAILTMPDRRSASERVGDAIHDLDRGAGKAARQLERRTPGQKLGDAVKDAGDKIKRNTEAPGP